MMQSAWHVLGWRVAAEQDARGAGTERQNITLKKAPPVQDRSDAELLFPVAQCSAVQCSAGARALRAPLGAAVSACSCITGGSPEYSGNTTSELPPPRRRCASSCSMPLARSISCGAGRTQREHNAGMRGRTNGSATCAGCPTTLATARALAERRLSPSLHPRCTLMHPRAPSCTPKSPQINPNHPKRPKSPPERASSPVRKTRMSPGPSVAWMARQASTDART